MCYKIIFINIGKRSLMSICTSN